jgi:lysozyme
MLKTSNKGVGFIKRHEGLMLNPYNCPAGYRTIGYGHLLTDGSIKSITVSEAINFLNSDIDICEDSIKRLITAPLSQNQFDALVSFVFNLGAGSLQRSSLRLKLNRLEYDCASNEFTKWVFAGGKRLQGLIRRRTEEKDLFRYGVY